MRSFVFVIALLGLGAAAVSSLPSINRATDEGKVVTVVSGRYGLAAVSGSSGGSGTVGPTGPTGPSGANGSNGSNGSNGAAGATGPSGATGPTGPDWTTSAQAIASITDETGSGAMVFNNAPDFDGIVTGDRIALTSTSGTALTANSTTTAPAIIGTAANTFAAVGIRGTGSAASFDTTGIEGLGGVGGHGGVFTGGNNGGHGVVGYGGTRSGPGIGTLGGAGDSVAPTGGPGGNFTGGTGYGAGNGNSGVGGNFTGGTPASGSGVAGMGLTAIGGARGATGIKGIGTTTFPGVWGVGGPSGAGGVFESGASLAISLVCDATSPLSACMSMTVQDTDPTSCSVGHLYQFTGGVLKTCTSANTWTIVGNQATAINASVINAGTVATARLGSGTANSTTFLRGDQTWQSLSGGATGPTGPSGTNGSNGSAGSTGPTGATGAGLSDGDKGDVVVSASGAVWSLDANVCSNAAIRQSGATSVIGRSANSTGNVADITCGSDDDVLRRQSSVLSCGTLATGSYADDSVTYAKMQNISATSRLLGRITSGAGDTEELTGTQATTLLDAFTSVLNGLVPASGGGTTNFLRADGTWAAPPGGSGGGGSVASDTIWDAKGDIAVGTSGDTAARLAVGGTGQVLTADPTVSTGVSWQWPALDIRNWYFIREDWTGSATAGETNWSVQSNSGTAAFDQTSTYNTADHYGIVTLSTGASASAAPVLHHQLDNLVFNGGMEGEFVWKSPSAVSDGTNTYNIRIGWTDTATGTTPNKGVYLKYIHSENSGNFRCCANDASVGEQCGNGSTALAADTWYSTKITFNEAYTLASCYVATAGSAYVANGTVGPTGLPNNTTHRQGPIFNIDKDAGTTARILAVDAFMMRKRVSR